MCSQVSLLAHHLATPSLGCKPKATVATTRKLVQETVVEEPTQDLDVPPKAMREEAQNNSEDEEDRDSLEDHESEEEQPNEILFTSEQLEVLFKMNRLDFTELVATL
jgi:hypothetical protein